MLFCLGDSSSHARDQYESMETDEGGQSGPARCEFLYSESYPFIGATRSN